MKYFVWAFLLCCVAAGCGKEDELTPSYADRDWFTVKDSEDPIGHSLFLLYDKYGIPVYVNDTIGEEDRGVDYYGNPIKYYYVLDMNYTVGAPVVDYSMQERKYTLMSKEEQTEVINFMDEILMPALPEGMHFNSILLTDSLYEMRTVGISAVRNDLDVYEGVMTLAIGQGAKIAKMTPEEREVQKGAILKTLLMNHLEETQLTEFYAVSADYYEKMVNINDPSGLNQADCRYYGFLDYGMKVPGINDRYKNVAKAADLEDYVLAYIQYAEEDFLEEFAAFPLVLEKYGLMKKVMEELGYSK